MEKSKVQMKKDAGKVGAALGGGLASAVIAKKVPSKFTGAGLLVAGIAGGILLKGAAQAAFIGMIPIGAVSTLNQFVAPKVAQVAEFLPGLSGVNGMGNPLLMGMGSTPMNLPVYEEPVEKPTDAVLM